MNPQHPIETAMEPLSFDDDNGISFRELVSIFGAHWRMLVAAPLVAGVAAFGIAFFVPPTFTAKTIFLPPQQQQTAAASAVASLGALSGLAAGVAGIKTPGDQYVALLRSVNVEDRILDRFKLKELYESKYRFEARNALEKNVRIELGKKDGLISIEVDAPEPKLASDIANQYVDELRRLTGELALTEAQQRRAFFEVELKRTRASLTKAQQALQSSGFNAGALKAEPKAAADNYAQIKAGVTAAEVRLQIMRRSLAESSPELQQQTALLGALRWQLARLESSSQSENDADYISRYRDFKYQETLFDLFAKQYELARMDESREGALIQVIDVATPPEYKSKPKRAMIAAGTTLAVLMLLSTFVLARHFWLESNKRLDTSQGTLP